MYCTGTDLLYGGLQYLHMVPAQTYSMRVVLYHADLRARRLHAGSFCFLYNYQPYPHYLSTGIYVSIYPRMHDKTDARL